MEITYDQPNVNDGRDVCKLIKDCPPLDVNSEYLYLLLCQHFAKTCIIAREGSQIAGFVSAYIPPNKPDSIFIWQVAVAKEFRKMGMSTKMIRSILSRPICDRVSYLEATVTPSNVSSKKMFESIAESLNCDIKTVPFFTKDHFSEGHEPEDLIRIGPMKKTLTN